MTTEIFLENNKLDITEDISSLITFAVDDVKDFGARNCSVSKTIVLPGTANNNKQFGHIFDVRISNPYDSEDDNIATNYNPAVSAQCLIFQDHINVFKGTLRVLEIVIVNGVPEYECAVFGEITALVGALGTSKLTDLDFSAYDQTWNASGIVQSWDNTPGSGVYFPLIDYGGYSVAKDNWDIRTFRPALYAKEYIDKIFEAADFTFDCDLFDTDRFKRLVIPYNQKLLFNQQPIALQLIETGEVFSGTTPGIHAWSGVVIAGGFTSSMGNKRWTYAGATISGQVYMTVHINSITNASSPPYEFQILKNGAEVGSFLIVLDTPPPGDITTAMFDITVENGDYVELNVIPPPFGTPSLDIGTSFLYILNSSPQNVQVNPGDQIKINSSIPRNILQKDFLSSIVKLFNLYITEDMYKSRHVVITPYVDYYDTNVTGIVDWTYKLDRGRSIRLKPMSELNSRYYEFNFKNDSDYYNDLYQKRYNQSYGSYVYDSGFEFTSEVNKLELIFSGTPLVGYAGEDKIISTIFKLSNDTEEQTDSNIRILQTKKVTGVAAWDILDDVAVLYNDVTTYGYAGHYDDPDAPANDIQFGVPGELFFTLVSGAINVTQFNVYWSPYMAEITDKDSKMLIAYFKLTNRDINSLDFSKFIYVDGSYWRLNKIIDWNANNPDVCQCELLKVINTLY